MQLGQLLGREARAEIGELRPHQRQDLAAAGRIDHVVGVPAARLMHQPRHATGTEARQQAMQLPSAQIQQNRRIGGAQPPGLDLLQNRHAFQIAPAHHHPSHARSPTFAQTLQSGNCGIPELPM